MMQQDQRQTTKDNVRTFDRDVRERGSYLYTAERLSARTANARLSASIAEAYDFAGKAVLDLGCGDGAYTVEFAGMGAREVVGIDPAAIAIEAARSRAASLGLAKVVRFDVGNIYALGPVLTRQFDCIVIRGVLHHLPDARAAIAALAPFEGTILIVEPNGNNPVLKLLEKYSAYHIEHEERSFAPALIRKWLRAAGFEVVRSKVVNLVPFFCPDWMVPILRAAEWPVERLPLIREVACGQSVIVARRGTAARQTA